MTTNTTMEPTSQSKMPVSKKTMRSVRFQKLVPKMTLSRSSSAGRRSRTYSASDRQTTCQNTTSLQKPSVVQRTTSLPVDLKPVEKSSKRLFWFIPIRPGKRQRPSETPESITVENFPDILDLEWLASSSSCDSDGSGRTEDDCNEQDLFGLDFLCDDSEELKLQ